VSPNIAVAVLFGLVLLLAALAVGLYFVLRGGKDEGGD
jgi:hypothetical protein